MKSLTLPPHSPVTEQMIHKLDHLLVTAHPTKLKNHLTTLLMKYLEHEHDALPPDFEDRMVDFQVLMEFLTVVEEESK